MKAYNKVKNQKMPIKTRENYNAYMRGYNLKKKQELIAKLGGKCEECGEKRIEVLSVSGGRKKKVLCHNCRESLKIKKVESKKES